MEHEEKKMYEGDWKCAKCGTAITKLPFEPDLEKLDGLKCLDCFKESRPQGMGERKMYSGNWKCAGCGTDITELPFEPNKPDNLKCRDCYRNSK